MFDKFPNTPLSFINSFLVFKLAIIAESGKQANLKMEVTRKQSPSNFPKNEHFLPPTCKCQEIRNVRFFGKFGVLCFLVTSILRFVLPKNHFHCVKKQQKKLSLNTGIYGLVKTLDSGILQAVFTRTTHIMLRVILARQAF